MHTEFKVVKVENGFILEPFDHRNVCNVPRFVFPTIERLGEKIKALSSPPQPAGNVKKPKRKPTRRKPVRAANLKS